MDTLIQTLRNIGPLRLTMMGGVLMALIGFFVYLVTRLAAPQLELLYGDLEATDSARVAAYLESQRIPFEMKQNGTQIYVAADAVPRVRVAVANQGMPSGGSIGYEIFDKGETLGTTTFQQNVNLVRALEGELARTIRAIDKVRSARVHLVLPKRELFSREKQEPSASIILKMRGGQRLDKEQVGAVQHLVAAAVPGLAPTRISIIDDRGTLLARGFEDESSPSEQAAKADERRRQFQNRLAQTIESLLERTVGFGKVRAQVNADMDFDRTSISEEKFDPDGQVPRSTQSVEEASSSREADQPPVSVGTNLPDPTATAGESAASSSTQRRTEETVNFEISKRVLNQVREAGVVKRLSVAVLVDGVRKTGADGKVEYQPRPAAEVEQLATLVRSAIGFNEDRGDSVEVINMPFAGPEDEAEPPIELFFGLGKNDLLRIAEILVLSIVAILVILLVVRPLVTRAFEAMPGAIGPDGRLLVDQTGAPVLTGPGGVPVPVPTEGGIEEEQFEELIDIDRVEGRVKASSVRKVGEIVDKHPEEAIAIIRTWIYQDS